MVVSMKVLIIGVTGRVGKRVAKLLADRGHEVVGINRRAHRVPVVLGEHSFETYEVDALDAPALTQLVKGTDAVLFASIPTREEPQLFLTQMRNVLDAIGATSTDSRGAKPRLVALSGHYALNAPDGQSMLEASPPNVYFAELEGTFAKQADLVRACSTEHPELEWLLVAPAVETYPYGEYDGNFRVQADTIVVTDPANPHFKETSKISFENLALFIADQIQQPTWHNALVSIGE